MGEISKGPSSQLERPVIYASGFSGIITLCHVRIALLTAPGVFISTGSLLPTPGKVLDLRNDTKPSVKGRAPLEGIKGPGENPNPYSEDPGFQHAGEQLVSPVVTCVLTPSAEPGCVQASFFSETSWGYCPG